MNSKTKKIVGIGLLTAIVVVLQSLAVGIKFGPFSVTFVLIPIVVGAASLISFLIESYVP